MDQLVSELKMKKMQLIDWIVVEDVCILDVVIEKDAYVEIYVVLVKMI